jgi:hypothetical protein
MTKLPGARTTQKKSKHARCVEPSDRIHVKTVQRLLYTLGSGPTKATLSQASRSVDGSDGLRPLAAAMTILLTDYGGTPRRPPARR